MRFLRKFNEAVNKKELKEFCEEYLAYLIDEGFEIEIVSEDGLEFVHISKPQSFFEVDREDETFGRRYQTFQWSEVKDQFIPFLKMLETNYNLEDKRRGNLVCFDYLHNHRLYNLNQILNDNLRKGDKDPTLRALWVYNIRSKR